MFVLLVKTQKCTATSLSLQYTVHMYVLQCCKSNILWEHKLFISDIINILLSVFIVFLNHELPLLFLCKSWINCSRMNILSCWCWSVRPGAHSSASHDHTYDGDQHLNKTNPNLNVVNCAGSRHSRN